MPLFFLSAHGSFDVVALKQIVWTEPTMDEVTPCASRLEARFLAARWASGAVLATLLLASSCLGRGCGCASGETAYAGLEGPVGVEIVRVVEWRNSSVVPFSSPSTAFSLRVHTTKPFDVSVPCAYPELAEDDGGTTTGMKRGEPSVYSLQTNPHTDFNVTIKPDV